MPDFTYETYYHCENFEEWGMEVISSKGKGKVYIVRWDNHNHRNINVQYDYSCTCESYKFRKTCKHIEQAKKYHCKWDQFTDGGDPVVRNGEKYCPNCGSPVRCFRYAV